MCFRSFDGFGCLNVQCVPQYSLCGYFVRPCLWSTGGESKTLTAIMKRQLFTVVFKCNPALGEKKACATVCPHLYTFLWLSRYSPHPVHRAFKLMEPHTIKMDIFNTCTYCQTYKCSVSHHSSCCTSALGVSVMEFMKIMVAKSNLDSHRTQPNKHLALARDSKMPAMDSLTAADCGLKSKADVTFMTKKRANSLKNTHTCS